MRFEISSPPPELATNNTTSDDHTNIRLSLVTFALILNLFGLCMLYSTSYDRGSALFLKQMTWAGLGICSAFVVGFIGYRKISEFALPILIFTLILVIIPRFFPPIKGAYRWIRLPNGFSIQPSEFAKIATIIFFAKFCANRQKHINSLKNTTICVGTLAIIAGLTGLVGQDLGTTFLISAVSWTLFFIAGLRLLTIIFIPMLAIPVLLIYLKLFDSERWSRIATILNPEIDPQDSGYQLFNSLMALGSGSWFGRGFTESKMKAYYLPEAHTDFILSIVGEEFGYLGMLFVLALYFALFLSSIKIAYVAKTKDGLLMAFGIAIMLIGQAIINIGVISGLFPTKGMPAPFISYGGSNILMVWIAIGLLFSIAANKKQKENIEHASIKISVKNENF